MTLHKEHSELEKKVNFWLSKLQVKTVQHHPPVQITDEDEANLEKAVTGVLNLIQTSNKEARIAELQNIPWKRVDRYGINVPYITKIWLSQRIKQLKQEEAK